MIEINLLPSGAQSRKAPARRGGGRPAGPSLPQIGGDPRLAALGAVAALLLLVGGYLFWQAGSRRAELHAQVQSAEAEGVRLQRARELVLALGTRRDTIERKIAVIQQVDGRRYMWPHLMDEISRATPPFTWLTKLTAADEPAPPPAAAPAEGEAAPAAPEGPPPGPAFSLEGNTGSTQSLTRFMKELESSPMIRDVSLVTSEQTELPNGRAVLKFTLEARWETPDTAFIQTVPLIPGR